MTFNESTLEMIPIWSGVVTVLRPSGSGPCQPFAINTQQGAR